MNASLLPFKVSIGMTVVGRVATEKAARLFADSLAGATFCEVTVHRATPGQSPLIYATTGDIEQETV